MMRAVWPRLGCAGYGWGWEPWEAVPGAIPTIPDGGVGGAGMRKPGQWVGRDPR